MGFGGMGNLGKMMKQAQKMQRDMAKMQEELKDKEVEASAGGGAVTVKVTGKQELISITISPEVVDADDIEMLQDLVLAAVNEEIMLIDFGAHLNFLNIDHLLFLPRFLIPLTLFITELAKIHQTANRRPRSRGHFHQIQILIHRPLQSFPGWYYTDLFSILIDQPYFPHPNSLVDSPLLANENFTS
jgi:DNA-binding YbaB/EbfC family protein